MSDAPALHDDLVASDREQTLPPSAPSSAAARVLAIVVNHEGADLTVRCVRSLASSSRAGDGGPHVVVVDNGSTSADVARLRAELPGVSVIEMGRNAGYAAALNEGIRSGIDAGVTHLWLLNNDLIVAPGALSAALDAHATVPDAGLVAACQLIPPVGPKRVRDDDAPSEADVYTAATVRGRLRDRHLACDGRCGPGWHAADVVTGAAMLASADLFRSIGLFDERFFHYGEEDELAERARAAGFQNVLACRSHVWHEMGATLPLDDPQAEYYRLRNLFLLRHQVDGWSAPRLLAHPGYAKAILRTGFRLRRDERSRLAFRSGLRHGMAGRSGQVDLPGRRVRTRARVLIVTHSAGSYGAERSLVSMLATLPRSTFHPIVVMPRHGPLERQLATMQVHARVIPGHAWRARRSGLIDFPLRFWTSAFATWRLARLIRTCDIDVVCSWTLGIPAGAFAARLAGRPHIWYAHEPIVRDDMRGLLPGALWLRLVERLSECVVSASTVVQAQFGRGMQGRHVIVPNQLRSDVTGERWTSRQLDTPRLAVIGTVAPHKRTIDAIRAFGIVRAQRPGATLHLWGDGPATYLAEVRAEARRLGLEASVSFHGFEPDPSVFLAADLVLHPAEHEAFGLAVLEAMTVGIPVVAARSQGLMEVTGDDGAVLVAPRDWEAMGLEASRILADADLYEQRAHAAHARAQIVVERTDSSAHARILSSVVGRWRRRS